MDEVRVKLCMYLVPRSNQVRWRGSRMDGRVLYADGAERWIGSDDIDDRLKEMVADVMWRGTSDEPAPYAPSIRECGRCELTAGNCREHMG